MERSDIGLWCCGCPAIVSYTPVSRLDLCGDLTGTCGGNTLAECEELIWAEMLSVSTGVVSGMLDDDDDVDDVMIAGMLLMNDCGAVLDMLDIPPGMATGFTPY